MGWAGGGRGRVAHPAMPGASGRTGGASGWAPNSDSVSIRLGTAGASLSGLGAPESAPSHGSRPPVARGGAGEGLETVPDASGPAWGFDGSSRRPYNVGPPDAYDSGGLSEAAPVEEV